MLRVPAVFLILAMGAALSACNKKAADSAAAGWDGPFSSPQKPGRYLGVGIYTPSQTWGKLVQAQADSAAGDARLSDDQAIIAVMDSRTGEIRACGDLTGYCVGQNPWASPLVDSRRTPVTLSGQDQDRNDGVTPADARAAAASQKANP